jgi:hypothetical protein
VRPILSTLAFSTGSSLVEDVEDAHPQHERDHRQHEDEIVEVDIYGILVSSPKTIVIHIDSEH